MSTPTLLPIVYPEDNGEPMAENTLQFQWIVTIKENLEVVFRDRPDVFVAGDLLWYPVEGRNDIRLAPDAMVVIGRPKGRRGSYMQWDEDGIAPQVVFEVLSPGNRAGELHRKFQFYDRYGIEEYYVYDPDRNDLTGSLRDDKRLVEIVDMKGWVSPRLGIRFEPREDTLRIYYPDGRPFLSFVELDRARAEAEQRRREVEQLRREAEQLRQEADKHRQEADKHRQEADKRADRLAAQLRALGIEPDA